MGNSFKARPIRHVENDIRPPYSIQFELTFKCNLSCNMCYNGSGQARPGELSDREWIEIVQQAIDLGILEAIISGGEPLLRGRDFVLRILRMLTDAGVATHFITNGTFVTPDFVRSLRGINMRLCQTSIDGPSREVHDAIRGKKNYDLVTRATHLLASHGFNTRIGCTIQRKNQDYIQEMIEQAVMLGANEIVIDEFLPIGRSIGNYDDILVTKSRDEIREEVRHLREVYQSTILVREGMACHDQLNQQAAMEVNDSIIIRPDGELRLGCMAPFSAGNAKKQGLAKAWSDAGAFAWKSHKVQEYICSVKDNRTLMEQQQQLGIFNGYENVQL
jgi:MoaA/NifB/PqqE/SkfB family radical SAM enzyme